MNGCLEGTMAKEVHQPGEFGFTLFFVSVETGDHGIQFEVIKGIWENMRFGAEVNHGAHVEGASACEFRICIPSQSLILTWSSALTLLYKG